MRTLHLVFSAGMFCACWGCSSDIEGIFGPPGGSDDGAGGTGAGAQTGPGPATGTATSGPATGASTTAVGTTTGSSMQTSSSAVSTSTGMLPPTVSCRGAGDCPTEGEAVCCWDSILDTGSCAASGEVCASGFPGAVITAIACDEPADCPGQICCAHREVQNAAYDDVTCSSQCDDNDRVVCDPGAPMCPPGSSCQGSQLLPPGYYVCAFGG